MNGLLPALFSIAVKDVKNIVKRKQRNAIAYCVAAVFGFTSYAAAIVTLGIYLTRTNDPLVAWGIIALMSLILFLLVITIISIVNYLDKRRRAKTKGAIELATSALTVVGTKSSKTTPVIPAVLIGALVLSALTKKSGQA